VHYIIVKDSYWILDMPVGIEAVNTHQKKTNNTDKPTYKDPLNNWVVKSLSYSNELGACVNEIAPKMTFALWIPTFMYLGADIYDKYKSDKTEYSPSRRRALDEAIVQGFTSFLLPAGAIILGQKITSPLGKLISGKLSINARETVYEHTKNAIEQCVGNNLSNKEKFIDLLKTSLQNKTQRLRNEKDTTNIFSKVYRYMTGYYAAADADRVKLMRFAQKNAEEIFELKENIENNKNLENIPKRLINKYKKMKPIMKELYGEDYALHALKSALTSHQSELIFKNKLIKTLGGIASLAILIKPINKFTNKVIMQKYIDPRMDKLENRIKDGNLLRLHVKKFDDYAQRKNKTTKILNVSEKTSKASTTNQLANLAPQVPEQNQKASPKQTLHLQT